MALPYVIHEDHARLSVRLTPSGGRDCFEGVEPDADRTSWLRARVSAPPEDGKANKALVLLLAKALRRPKSSISFLSGETGRKKILRIVGDPEEMNALLRGLCGISERKP